MKKVLVSVKRLAALQRGAMLAIMETLSYDQMERPNCCFILTEMMRLLDSGITNINNFYENNIPSDITDIVDNSGNIIARYQYDPWDKLLRIACLLTEKNVTFNLF